MTRRLDAEDAGGSRPRKGRSKVLVEASASSANLGPGFDSFALALSEPRDRLELQASAANEGEVELVMEGGGEVTSEPSKNAAGAVVLSVVERYKLRSKITVRLAKGVPVGVGLGSSGASSAAATVAMDRVFGLRMSAAELIAHAGEGERAVAGAAHLDNVTASIMGGFVIVRQGDAAPIRFTPPGSLSVVVVTPSVVLPERKTEYARSLVPKTVPTRDMVHNVSMASVMVAGFAKGDIGMIGSGMEDAVVEVARTRMIPGFAGVKRAAKSAGAAGVCISGAGPSMLSIVDASEEHPRKVLEAMVKGFDLEGVKAKGFVTSVGGGAKVLESS